MDIARTLVRQGLALDWPLFSKGFYRRFERTDLRRKLSYVRRKMKAAA